MLGLRIALIVLSLLFVLNMPSIGGEYPLFQASMSEINETASRFSVTPDKYDADRVTVSLGPYHISFLTRLENVCCVGEYRTSYLNRSTGSRKDYHVCTYDLGELWVYEGPVNDSKYPSLRLSIYRYVGPTSYPPTDPDPSGFSVISSFRDTSTMSREYTGPDPLIIDGKRGTLLEWWPVIHNINVVYPSDSFDVVGNSYYVAAYQPDDKTFVVLSTDNSIDYDKDVALVLETLHIST